MESIHWHNCWLTQSHTSIQLNVLHEFLIVVFPEWYVHIFVLKMSDVAGIDSSKMSRPEWEVKRAEQQLVVARLFLSFRQGTRKMDTLDQGQRAISCIRVGYFSVIIDTLHLLSKPIVDMAHGMVIWSRCCRSVRHRRRAPSPSLHAPLRR